MTNKTRTTVLIIAHALVLFVALLSPLWLDWKIVAVGYVLYILQKWIFKGCLLSFSQFGSKDGRPSENFTPYYLRKIFGLKTEDYLFTRYLDYMFAPLVPIVAYTIQILFHYQPLIRFL